MINCPWCFLQQTLGFVALAKWVSLLFWNTASTVKVIFTTGSKLSGVFLHWAAVADDDHHHHDSGTIFQVLNDRRKLPKLSSFASYCFPAVCDRTAFALKISFVWYKIWKSIKASTLWTNSTIALHWHSKQIQSIPSLPTALMPLFQVEWIQLCWV